MAVLSSGKRLSSEPLGGHPAICDYNSNSFVWRSQGTQSLILSLDQDWNWEIMQTINVNLSPFSALEEIEATVNHGFGFWAQTM